MATAGPKLSKGVMSMKFMHAKSSFDPSPATSDLKQENIETIESVDLIAKLPGRRSFGGFNKPIERYYGDVLDRLNVKRITTQTAALNSKEIENLENLVSLPRGPNQGKKKQNVHQTFAKSGKRELEPNSSGNKSKRSKQ